MFDDLDQEKKEDKRNAPLAPPQNLSSSPAPAVAPPTQEETKAAHDQVFDNRMQKLEEKGRKRGIKFSKIGLTVGFIVALCMMAVGYYLLTDVISFTEKAAESAENNVGRSPRTKTATEAKLAFNMKQCEQNSDCVETQAGCCNCANGGQQAAINRSYNSEWDRERNDKCGSVVCPAVTNCVSGEVLCENGECTFQETRNECWTEGEAIDSSTDDKPCCEDLVKASPFQRLNLETGACEILEGLAFCLNCGDGVCGENEDKCSCPQDCEEEVAINDMSDWQIYRNDEWKVELKYPSNLKLQENENGAKKSARFTEEENYIFAIEVSDEYGDLDTWIKEVYEPMDKKPIGSFERTNFQGHEAAEVVYEEEDPSSRIVSINFAKDGKFFSISKSSYFELTQKVFSSLVFLESNEEIIPTEPERPVVLDTDGDGLTDDEELSYGTDPNNPDTDGDGLTDYEEIFSYGTDPNNPDTDGDGYTDGSEVANGYNPLGEGKLNQ